MAPNPFFEKTVCIQTDHRHRVIDSEACVHCAILASLNSTLSFSGAGAALLIAIGSLLLVIQMEFDGRILQAELLGYADCVTQVCFRLIPRVWRLH